MAGYKDWIDAIDIKVDYFSAFMKAWIAFNAWYNCSDEVPGKNDKECIEYIASQTNRFKTYTMGLIEKVLQNYMVRFYMHRLPHKNT